MQASINILIGALSFFLLSRVRVKALLCFILLSLTQDGFAVIDTVDTYFKPIELDQAHSGEAIDNYIYYYADKTNKYNAKDIFSNKKLFIPLKEKALSLGTKTHWYWIHMKNPSDHEVTWYISSGVSTPPLLRGYWQSLNHGLGNQKTPYDETLEGKSIHGDPRYAFDLKLKPGEAGNLVIEYQSLANFPLTIRPYLPESLASRSETLLFFNGVYFGAICVFLLLFSTQFLVRPNRTHFYYLLFVFSIILIMVQVSGFRWLSDIEIASRYGSQLTTLIGGSIYVWYFLFSAEFLELKNIAPRLNKILRSLSAITLILTCLSLFLPLAYLLSVVVALGLPWPIISALNAIKHQHASAKFFLLGSTTHCLTTYLLLFACLGFETQANNSFFGLASIGLMVDVCCFAIGILYQNNQLRIRYNIQQQERINDLNSLAESEQISAKALSMSKQAILDTAATAHDLQQPLSSMEMMISMQNQQDPVVKQTKEALDYARELLHVALNSSKKNYQQLQQNINPQSLLQNALKRQTPILKNKNIESRVFCKDAELTCLPLVVNRILDNLLSNVAKYAEHKSVLVSGRKRTNGDYLIQVWDTGKGMNDSQVKKIVTPFEQLKQNQSDNLGFGLGLYIVKSLCEQAGYTLNVKSKEGHGSCFSITIPHKMES